MSSCIIPEMQSDINPTNPPSPLPNPGVTLVYKISNEKKI